jgi:hypothetical protein
VPASEVIEKEAVVKELGDACRLESEQQRVEGRVGGGEGQVEP